MTTQTATQVDVRELKSSSHFFETGKIPEIEAHVSFQQAYRTLNGGGAFFLVKDGKQQHFVRARLLADFVLRAARQSLSSGGKVAPATPDKELARELARMFAEPIEQIVERAYRESPVLPIYQVPGDIDHNLEVALSNFEDRVFDIFEAGEHVGWYLNHESVRDASTDKTIFVCTNPVNPHENIDPDHGTCSSCPFPLANTK